MASSQWVHFFSTFLPWCCCLYNVDIIETTLSTTLKPVRTLLPPHVIRMDATHIPHATSATDAQHARGIMSNSGMITTKRAPSASFGIRARPLQTRYEHAGSHAMHAMRRPASAASAMPLPGTKALCWISTQSNSYHARHNSPLSSFASRRSFHRMHPTCLTPDLFQGHRGAAPPNTAEFRGTQRTGA